MHHHWSPIGIGVSPTQQSSRPYPKDWEQVADLRVFHTTPQEWEKLIGWRADMQRRGWRLLQVFSRTDDMVAVFGRTKQELLQREQAQT